MSILFCRGLRTFVHGFRSHWDMTSLPSSNTLTCQCNTACTRPLAHSSMGMCVTMHGNVCDMQTQVLFWFADGISSSERSCFGIRNHAPFQNTPRVGVSSGATSPVDCCGSRGGGGVVESVETPNASENDSGTHFLCTHKGP